MAIQGFSQQLEITQVFMLEPRKANTLGLP